MGRRAEDRVRKGRDDLQDRELVIYLKNVTAISREGENVLLELMNERVKFRCGVFTRHVLKQLALRMRRNIQETKR